MARNPQEAKWDWRSALTAEELAIIQKADAELERLARARERYEKRFGRVRQLIVNRAIHRAKYAAGSGRTHPAQATTS